MSELGLSVEPLPQPGKHRASRQRKPPPKQKGRAGRSFVAFLVVVLVLGGIGYGGWLGVVWLQDRLGAEDYAGGGTNETVVVEIQDGMVGADIGRVLAEAGVVASQRAFVDAARANPEAANIQGGCFPFLDLSPCFYQLPMQMSASAAVAALLDPDHRLGAREASDLGLIALVTIPEGLSSFRTFALLSADLDIPLDELYDAAEDPIGLGVPDFWFNRSDELEVEPSIEGFLFPSTYEFAPGPGAEQVLQAMVSRFLAVAQQLDFVSRVENERNILPYEALIVASLAQAEAGVDDDLGKVARVAYNRVYRDNPGQLACNRCLQFDVTVNYWFELNGLPTKSSSEMTDAELTDPTNPYNRNVQGLVPTPINNPGEAALTAAMDPPDGEWLFFVAIDEEGNSAFADTFAEHCQNAQVAVQNGILDRSPC